MKVRYRLKINQPEFDNYYFELYKKVDYRGYSQSIINAIKSRIRDLILDNKINTGVRIVVEKELYEQLKDYGRESDINYTLRDLGQKGYFKLLPDGMLELNFSGKDWAMNNIVDSEIKNSGFKKLNRFDVPPNCSNKLKKLLNEINDLPADNWEDYKNLIAHQIRTVLTLGLLHFHENILNNKPDNENLKNLIIETIKLKVKKYERICNAVKELREARYKDLADDIIHCNYSLIDEKNCDGFMNCVKNILSLIYGR